MHQLAKGKRQKAKGSKDEERGWRANKCIPASYYLAQLTLGLLALSLGSSPLPSCPSFQSEIREAESIKDNYHLPIEGHGHESGDAGGDGNSLQVGDRLTHEQPEQPGCVERKEQKTRVTSYNGPSNYTH